MCRQPEALTYLLIELFLERKLGGAALGYACSAIQVHAAFKACMVSSKAVCWSVVGNVHLQGCFHIEELYHKDTPSANLLAIQGNLSFLSALNGKACRKDVG